MPLFKNYHKNKKACRTMKVTTGKDEMCPDYTTSSLWQQMIEDQSWRERHLVLNPRAMSLRF